MKTKSNMTVSKENEEIRIVKMIIKKLNLSICSPVEAKWFIFGVPLKFNNEND